MTLEQFKALPHPDWYETGGRHERLCGPVPVAAYWNRGLWRWTVWGLGFGSAGTLQDAKDEAWSTACREVHGSLSDLGAWGAGR